MNILQFFFKEVFKDPKCLCEAIEMLHKTVLCLKKSCLCFSIAHMIHNAIYDTPQCIICYLRMFLFLQGIRIAN